MGDKKHIDRLFQERFKDFEVQPDDAVWDNIEAKLNEKKKKRRVIPIWWRYAGVAALLLLTFTIGSYIFNGDISEDITPQVVDTEQTDVKNTTDENLQKKSENIINTDNTSVVSNDGGVSENKSNLPSNTNSKETFDNTSKSGQQKTTIANSKDNSSVKTASEASKNKSKALYKNDAPKVVADNTINRSKTEVENTSTLKKNKTDSITEDRNPQQNATKIASNNANVDTNTPLSTSDIETSKVAENDAKKEGRTIEEAIEKNQSLLEEEKKTEVAGLNKWSISPNAAPVYFGSLGKGSTIGNEFNENSKTGEVNMSFGLNASYALNKRLTIRSGVNRVNLGYNTNDVLVFNSVNASANAKTLHTLSSNVADNTTATSAISAGENVSIMSATSFKSSNISDFETTNTSINQSFGFIEVPLELQYSISTKRLGVNVIGGFSSFFLNNYDESISAFEGQPTRLQASDNINNTSYSANFGLGLNYKVSEKINLNLEPMFKYQINTFKNTSGDFQPFFIGVYTGFGIKF